MDREIPTSHVRKRIIKRISVIILAILLVITGILGFRSILKSSIKRNMIQTAFAENGSIEATITASGTVVPEFEQIISSPIQSKIEMIFHRAGESIGAGESILELNKEYIKMSYRKIKDEYELKMNRKTQLQLELDRRLIDLQTQLDIKKLKIKSLESKLELEKRLLKIGGGTKESLELAELNLEIARRELEQLNNEIENQRKSAIADLRELDLQIRIQENSLNEILRQVELAEAKADRDGVITYVNDNIGAAVNTGEIVARVADLGSFKIQATISDFHASKLKSGNRVNVRIGDVRLRGTITSIRPTIENGIITFIVELNKKSHEALRSNLRVDVFVVTSFKDNVIRVANGPFVNGSGVQDIFIIEGDKAVRRTVTIGATNFDFVEIENDVDVGEEVIISNMEDYIHTSEVEIVND